MKKYKVIVKNDGEILNYDLEIRDNELFFDSEDTTITIPYNDIKNMYVINNKINIRTANDKFFISCEDMNNLLVDIKNKYNYEKNENESKKTNLFKIGVFISIFIIMFLINSFLNSGLDPAYTISRDIKDNDFIYGYGTQYTIGEIINVSCSNDIKDNNGRTLVKCSLSYYPKRNNGTIATDSKMNEVIYAIFMPTSKKEYLRIYKSSSTTIDEFKTKNCWGENADKKLLCNY